MPEFGGEKAEGGKRGIGFNVLLRRAPRDGEVDAVDIGSDMRAAKSWSVEGNLIWRFALSHRRNSTLKSHQT